MTKALIRLFIKNAEDTRSAAVREQYGILSDAVVIGMGRSSRAPASDYARAINTLLDAGLEYRRFGAGALMLAHVAAGQLHAYYEAHMNSWDALAGMLLIEEAGGTCNAFLANAGLRRGNLVLAGCASVQPRLAALLAK